MKNRKQKMIKITMENKEDKINKEERISKEHLSALFYAKNEKNITGQSVLVELMPLIKEYFYCSCQIYGNILALRFLNGQAIIISAKEGQ